eukprot:c20540_g2_i2.p1 GENE.c20540_g2_i2~~c20540_g2_i2.p1  ORF type:complete len:250 (+),score=33.01 c20540_g2_i2:84-752(+)
MVQALQDTQLLATKKTLSKDDRQSRILQGLAVLPTRRAVPNEMSAREKRLSGTSESQPSTAVCTAAVVETQYEISVPEFPRGRRRRASDATVEAPRRRKPNYFDPPSSPGSEVSQKSEGSPRPPALIRDFECNLVESLPEFKQRTDATVLDDTELRLAGEPSVWGPIVVTKPAAFEVWDCEIPLDVKKRFRRPGTTTLRPKEQIGKPKDPKTSLLAFQNQIF